MTAVSRLTEYGHPLYMRLRHYDGLADEAFRIFEAIDKGVQEIDARSNIWQAGETPGSALIVESGWAFHYRDLPDGGRHICQLLMPGDVIDGAAMLPGGQSITSVCAASSVHVRRLDTSRLFELLSGRPDVAAAFWWLVVQTDNIFREHITRVGRRTSAESVAHLLLELAVRSEMAGLVRDGAIHVPLTQTHIADYLGITPVHVSRTLTLLKHAGYLTFDSKTLHFLKLDGLKEFSAFESAYLTVGCEVRPRAARAEYA